MIDRRHVDPRQLPIGSDKARAKLELLKGVKIAVGKITQTMNRACAIEPAAIEPVDINPLALSPGISLGDLLSPQREFEICGFNLAHTSANGRIFSMALEKSHAMDEKVRVEYHVAVEQIEIGHIGRLKGQLRTGPTATLRDIRQLHDADLGKGSRDIECRIT